MKINMVQNVIGFVLKYIWVFCALLVVLEISSVTYTASVLMQETTHGVLQSVAGQVNSRVDGVLRMLTGIAQDQRFADTSKPMYDRIIQARPYQDSYNLFMIALTDEDVNVVSADTTEAPTEFTSLAYRDYMQRLYATGKYQITNAMLSGDGSDTMNYTIAVPILKDGKVEGSVFGSIYFDDIEKIIASYAQIEGRSLFLLGADNTLMTGGDRAYHGKSFLELSEDRRFFGREGAEVDADMTAGTGGSFWQWSSKGPTYAAYQRVEATEWTILYRVQFSSVWVKLLPVLCVKTVFYLMLCAAIYFFGRWYLDRQFARVNHLLNRMAVMQKELFQSEQPDYDNLLEMTQQGLTDQLTGLCTRAILFKKMMRLTEAADSAGAIIFIDLDDLKRINDKFGHEGGDCALIYFAQVLKEFEQKHGGIAARYGGDEFILVLSGIEEAAATEIAQKLCAALNSNINTKEHTFPIHGSLGVSFYPEHGRKSEELICKADLALYSAKQDGKNRCAFYSEGNGIL